MSNRLFLRPRLAGAVIRDPHTKRKLPASGGWVADCSFWRRRLRSTEVEVSDPPNAKQPTSAPAPVLEE